MRAHGHYHLLPPLHCQLLCLSAVCMPHVYVVIITDETTRMGASFSSCAGYLKPPKPVSTYVPRIFGFRVYNPEKKDGQNPGGMGGAGPSSAATLPAPAPPGDAGGR